MNKTSKKRGHIHVISCGIERTFSDQAKEYLAQADIVFASQKLLEACPFPLKNTRIIAVKAREDAQDALNFCQEGKNIVVLASGDALYNGFGATLLALRQDEAMTFHPNITAFQALFHRIAMPWKNVRLFSAHANKKLALREIASCPFALIYGGTEFPVHIIAQKLIEFHNPLGFGLALVAERLGTTEEKIYIDTLLELSKQKYHPTAILLLIPKSHEKYVQERYSHSINSLQKNIINNKNNITITEKNTKDKQNTCSHLNLAPSLPLGLAEDFYERENNLITASDVRAIILARLNLPLWGTLWDLGAGSGSIGLEAAGLCPYLTVLGVEKNSKRMEIIEKNKEKMSVDNYSLYHTDILSFLKNFQKNSQEHPQEYSQVDRIFIGGGGSNITEIVELSLACLSEKGLLVASAVTLESFHALSNCAKGKRVHVSSIQIAHESPIAGQYTHFKAQNTIYIFTFRP